MEFVLYIGLFCKLKLNKCSVCARSCKVGHLSDDNSEVIYCPYDVSSPTELLQGWFNT